MRKRRGEAAADRARDAAICSSGFFVRSDRAWIFWGDSKRCGKSFDDGMIVKSFLFKRIFFYSIISFFIRY